AVITQVVDSRHREDLVRIAMTLAAIRLYVATIEELTKEAGMPWTLDEDTVGGRSIAVRAEARGRARTLGLLMRRTIGEDPRIDALAAELAAMSQEKAIDAVLGATTIDELVALVGSRAVR